MRLWLMRHAETAANAEHRLQGRWDCELSARGAEQARAVAAELARWPSAPAVVYCSTLVRTLDTYAPLQALPAWPQATALAELDEIGVGELEGLTRDEIEQRHSEFAGRPLSELGDFSRFGGERYDDVQARVELVIARLRQLAECGVPSAFILAHGGILKQLLKALICRPAPRNGLFHMGNCCLAELSFGVRMGEFVGELQSLAQYRSWVGEQSP